MRISWPIRPFISRKRLHRRNHKRTRYLEALESRVLLSFAPADVSGTWTYAAMGAEGTIQFDGADNVSGGSLQRANGTTVTPQGTYAIDATGVVTVATNISLKSGAMNSTRDLTVLTVPGSGTLGNSLSLLVKHTATIFSNADLSGTWNLFINGDGGGNTGLGSMNFDGNGNITGGSNTDVHGVSTITGGNYTVSSSGQVAALIDIIQDDGVTPGSVSVTGWINDAKDAVAFNPPDIATAASTNQTRLIVLVHDSGVYSNASLNTTWEFVGDGYKGALTFDGAGAASGAGISTSGATMALSGSYSVATGGTFTLALNVVTSSESIALDFKGAISESRNFGAMEQVPFNNGTDSSRDSLIMMVDTGALSAAPGIGGNWTYASTSQEGSILFDDAGNVIGGSLTDTLNTGSTPAGTYTLGAGGSVSIITTDTRTGARNSARDVMAIANPAQGKTLSVLVNGGTAVFSNGDLAGTWNLAFNGDSAGNNGVGTIVFDGQGSITGGTIKNGNGTQAVTGGSYVVNTDGTCTVNVTTAQGTLNFTGAMNASMDVLALSPTDLQGAVANHSTDLTLLVKTGGTYTNATIAGTWTLETENGSGTVILDGAGHVSGGFNDGGGAAVLSGTYAVAAGGTFSVNVLVTQGTSHHSSAFTGAINAGHNVMIENQISASAGNNLAVLVFAANHAPTFSAVTPLNVAAVGHDFSITRGMLLAASNAKDSDANPLQFTLTALGSGALALNGAPVGVPVAFGAADMLTWTPPAGTGGTFTAFSVTVTDGLTPPTAAVPVAINTIVPETFGAGTLNHTWIVAGDSSEGSILFDGAGSITGGSITDDSGTTNALSGTYTINPSGAVSLVGGDHPASGAINGARDVAVVSDSHSLVVLVDSQRGANYSNADLSGTWNVIAGGQDPSSNAVGTVIFNGAGLVTGGSVQTGTASFNVAGTYTVSADGTFAVSLLQTGQINGISLHGALNDSKDVAAVSANDLQAAEANSNPLLMLFVHAGGAYTNADAKGTWFISSDGANGYVTLDGAGHIKSGFVVSTHGNGTTDAQSLTGTYAVAANGQVTFKLVATTGGAGQSLTLTGAMNAGRNMMVENQIGPSSSSNLIVFTSTQDHAPTLKTVVPQATAIGTLPFDITYAQLLAASNAADADKDTLQFQVTSLGAGSFTLDGNAAPATPFLISPGDTLEWTPPATSNGNVTAFSVKAFDGILASATAVPVVIKSVLPPTVSITANKPTASELNNGTTTGVGQFTISRAAGDLNQSLTVHYTIGGTAINGTDYATIANSYTFTPRQTSATLSIIPIADSLLEGAETVTLTLVPDSNTSPTYKLNPAKTLGSVTIADVLASPVPLAGALKNTPFSIAYGDLLAAVGVVSASGQPISFKITAIKSGTLKKNGVAVVPNSTTLASGDGPLTWTPPANTIGTKAAFTMTASDGISLSTVLTLSITIT